MKLEHVVVVRSEARRARNPRGDLAAGSGVKPFHRDENGKNTMTLNECLSRLRESGDVMLVFSVDLRARLEEINGAVLAVLICAGSGARYIFADAGLHRPHTTMNRPSNHNPHLY